MLTPFLRFLTYEHELGLQSRNQLLNTAARRALKIEPESFKYIYVLMVLTNL